VTEAGPDLAALDAALRRALDRGDESGIRVLGYGEIAAVVGWPADAPRWACKRLPPFRDAAQLERYAQSVTRYVQALEAAGVRVLPSTVASVETPDGLIGYIVQPVVDAERLAPRYLTRCADDTASAVLDRVLSHVLDTVTPRVGLDAQLSNWFVDDDGGLLYLDLTTPMLRDEGGCDELDAGLFLASLPWALRGLVYRFVLRGVLDKYFDPRGVVIDVLANLLKERLAERLLPRALALAERTPGASITDRDVRRYYRSDAGMWAFLQRLRRADSWWQRKVRRRGYPFLLPGRIQR
jgi:hypothetical protein